MRYILTDSYSNLKTFVNSSKLANIVVPIFFVLLGVFLIYDKQVFPEIKQAFEARYLNQGNIAIVDDQYLDLSIYVSNPSNLSELSIKAFEEDILALDTKSKDYNGVFYITIPSLGINRLPVQSNVNSTDEEEYNKVLNSKLAHFGGTGLPISDVRNNMVVYGHSASLNYNPKPSDPYVAFSFLPEIKVGDEIVIEMEGNTYKYRMFKSKIVEPNDVSIITGSRNSETLTLFTCYPIGNNSQRFVAIARPIS